MSPFRNKGWEVFCSCKDLGLEREFAMPWAGEHLQDGGSTLDVPTQVTGDGGLEILRKMLFPKACCGCFCPAILFVTPPIWRREGD